MENRANLRYEKRKKSMLEKPTVVTKCDFIELKVWLLHRNWVNWEEKWAINKIGTTLSNQIIVPMPLLDPNIVSYRC